MLTTITAASAINSPMSVFFLNCLPPSVCRLFFFELFFFMLHSFKKLPFSAEQNHSCSEQEDEDHTAKIDDVSGVNHALADGGVMVLNTQILDIVAKRPERFKRINEGESEEDDETEGGGDDESHNLVVGKTGREKPDGDEGGTQEEQSEIGPPRAAHVDVADRVAKEINGDDIDQGWQERNDQQSKAGAKLGPDNLHVGQRLGEQEVHGAVALFFSK